MMRNGSDSGEGRKRFHVVGGMPFEDDCEICRAHGIDRMLGPEDGPQIIIMEMGLQEILRCPCPLCSQARPRVMDEE